MTAQIIALRAPIEPEPECEVCDGALLYPINNMFGETLYFIECPECAEQSNHAPGDAA